MAKVFEGYDPVGDRVLAVKVLKTEFTNSPEVVASFVQEAKKAIRLENHDAVLTVYEVDQDGDTPFIAMRRVEGLTLQDDLKKRGVLPVDRVRGIVASVGGALEHAHQRGIVHCDVKPSNIMLDRVGRAYLMDFGISRAVGDMLGARLEELSAYTPQYASPEQTKGQPATVRSDIYSFGVVVYEMVTGTTPFGHCQTAADLRHAAIHEAPCPPRDINPNVPPILDEVISRALAKDPLGRFDSMAQFVQAVLQATDEGPSTDVTLVPQRVDPSTVKATAKSTGALTPTRTDPAAHKPRSQAKVVGILALAGAIAVGGVFGWDWWRRPAAERDGGVEKALAAARQDGSHLGGGEEPNSVRASSDPLPRMELATGLESRVTASDAAPPIATVASAATDQPEATTPPSTEPVVLFQDPTPDRPPEAQPKKAAASEQLDDTRPPDQDAKAQAHSTTRGSESAPLAAEPATTAPPLPEPRTYALPTGWDVEVLDDTRCALTSLPRRVRDTATGIELVLVPPGSFRMGARATDLDALTDEIPLRWVTITRPFYMATAEVTIGQWRKHVAQAGASQAPLEDLRVRMRRKGLANAAWGDDHPVLRVTWSEATAYCGRYGFRLPTEAQWEYACRAGTESVYWFGDDQRDATGVENVFDGNAKAASKTTGDSGFPDPAWGASDDFSITAPVRRFKANPLGLHDLHGNVSEWCHDAYRQDAYLISGSEDPVWQSGDKKVVRGGSWKAGPQAARASSRHGRADERHYDVGFRVTRSLGQPTK